MTEIFNEKKLGQEIYSTWGEHGAHAEIYRSIIKQRETLLNVAKDCLEALQPDSGEVENLDDPVALRSSLRQALWSVEGTLPGLKEVPGDRS
jgi:hypothetical protein